MNPISSPQIASPPQLLNPALNNNAAQAGETSFKDMLFDSFQEVNNMQLDADRAVNDMFTGGDVSPAEVLTAVQKADLAFPSVQDLDGPVEALSQRKPRFPCDVPKEAGSGQALLEFIVDERGLVQLPAIVEATHDAFGYAAVQAVSSWRFRPPTINGKPTSIKVRMPFGFRR